MYIRFSIEQMGGIKKIATVFVTLMMYLHPSVHAQSDYNDVASIFYAHCTSCHHDGGVSGISFLTYSETAAYTAFIQNDLITSHMPPWQPDTAYTTSGYPVQRFLHENTITVPEKNAILQWINDGALEGNPALAPPPPVYDDTQFKLNGNPSLTLKIPNFSSNSSLTNQNPYDCFSVPSGLTQDRWLQAFEIVPGNFAAVHDVTIILDTTGSVPSDLTGYCNNQTSERFIGSWTPGCKPTVFPNDPSLKAGMLIPAGSNFIFQIHYAPGTGGLLDSTKIRLFFYPTTETGIRPIHSNAFLQYWGTFGVGGPDILANTTKSITATPAIQSIPHTLPPVNDISLLSVRPFSRNICTEATNYALSGTDTIPLIHVKEWYYEWNSMYYYPNLVKIPAGYTLTTERFFDNTVSNQHQPSNPPVNVNFGTNSSNEMIYDSFQWLDYQAGDELLDMSAIVANDTLLQVGITQFARPTGIQSFIYPNPATDNLSIYLSKRSDYKARIYSLTGQNVMRSETFRDGTIMDVKNIPAGLYIIEITDIRSNERVTSKIVITD